MAPEIETYQWRELHDFVVRLFLRIGMPREDAVMEADALMWANLRGVDSHGVVRIPWYVENVRIGIMNPRPDIKVTVDTPAVAMIEADRAFGPIVTNMAADMAVEKARHVGIGCVLIRNLTHQGAMGPYVQRIARNLMAGLIFACSPPNMVPFGARAAGVNNSPFALSVPAGRHAPLLVDMATSVVALGKVLVARDRGVSIPEGWGIDAQGNPTTDPNTVAALLPVGGPKGSGMALLFECMSSVMARNPLIVPALVNGAEQHNQNCVIAAIDVSQFTDVDEYRNEVDRLIDQLKQLPRAQGVDEILMPGEQEERVYSQRIKAGIPVPVATADALKTIAADLDIEFADASAGSA